MIQNLFDVSGKVALVTGGAKGIGAMITQGLVEAGVKVYISSRSSEDCNAFAEKMNEIGECVALPTDLLVMENIENLAKAIGERESKLDILVNNSGASWGAPLGEFPEKGWDKVMDLNVKSLFFLTQSLLPLILAGSSKESPGRIINISSIMAVAPMSMGTYSYGASKAAVVQLTRNLAHDLVKKQVLVNAIAPGFFPTKMTAKVDDKIMLKVTPIGRLGQPTDIAGLVIFLCSNAGSFMTGNYIPLDGGALVS